MLRLLLMLGCLLSISLIVPVRIFASEDLKSELKNEFVVVVSEDYSPFSFFSAKQKSVQGITVDVLREVFKKIPDVSLKVLAYPWPRAQQMVKSGLADAMITYPSQERLQYADKAEHFAYQTFFKVFTFKDNPNAAAIEQLQTMDQLNEQTLCEYNASGWAKDNIVGKIKHISFSSTFESKIKMLLAKRCSIIIENEVTVLYLARKMGQADRVKQLAIPGWSAPFAFLLSKKSKHKELLKTIDEGFKNINKGKVVENIINKWAHEN